MGQRSRKRDRTEPPPAAVTAEPEPRAAHRSRSEERNAAVRATLVPLAAGERPWAIKIGAFLAAASGLSQLVLFAAGVKLKLAGTDPKAAPTIVFAAVMLACAVGVWYLRYWAVLGLMALVGITVATFALALIKAATVLGAVIALAVIAGGGLLFYKLVRVLSRIQMPTPPTRS